MQLPVYRAAPKLITCPRREHFPTAWKRRACLGPFGRVIENTHNQPLQDQEAFMARGVSGGAGGTEFECSSGLNALKSLTCQMAQIGSPLRRDCDAAIVARNVIAIIPIRNKGWP